jgi:hypothetical protein
MATRAMSYATLARPVRCRVSRNFLAEDFALTKSNWFQFFNSLALLIAGGVFSGCSDETIQLKRLKAEDVPPIVEKNDKDLPRSARPNKGSSAGIKRDPSGMHPNSE